MPRGRKKKEVTAKSEELFEQPLWVRVEFQPGVVCEIAAERIAEILEKCGVIRERKEVMENPVKLLELVRKLTWTTVRMYAFWRNTTGQLSTTCEKAWETAQFTVICG
ncbi:MAG: hypothetical protein WC373_00820 [Smithella sp.]|jgi:hypothetical protein